MAQSTTSVVITQCHQTVKSKRRLQEAASVVCIKGNKPGSLASSQPRSYRRMQGAWQVQSNASGSKGSRQLQIPPTQGAFPEASHKLQQQQPSNASVTVPMQHVSRSLSRCQQCNHTKLPTLAIQPPVQPCAASLIAQKRPRAQTQLLL